MVLNARTDVYLLQVGDPAKRYDAAVKRLGSVSRRGCGLCLPSGRSRLADNRQAGLGLALSCEHSCGTWLSFSRGVDGCGREAGQLRFWPDESNARPLASACAGSKHTRHLLNDGGLAFPRRNQSADESESKHQEEGLIFYPNRRHLRYPRPASTGSS